MRMFDDIYAVYTPAHAWIYETMVAPAVYRSRTIIDQRFLDLLPRGARVLDVGSGGGRFTTYMAEQRADLDLLGVDLSPPQIRRSTRAARRLGGRVRFQLGIAGRRAE
jgi:cyclopropane fatty-acyl-phospholipid synthase-like methyltransferase